MNAARKRRGAVPARPPDRPHLA